MYLGVFRPYENRLSNFIEIFNEITIMIIGYLLFLLTDFTPDPFE
jgi:hypothetical protein